MYNGFRLFCSQFMSGVSWKTKISCNYIDVAFDRTGIRRNTKVDLNIISDKEIQTVLSRPWFDRAIHDGYEGIIIDACSLVALHNYPNRVVLAENPFDDVDIISKKFNIKRNDVFKMMYAGIMNATHVFTLGIDVYHAVYNITTRPCVMRNFPITPILKPDEHFEKRKIVILLNRNNKNMLDILRSSLLDRNYDAEVFLLNDNDALGAQVPLIGDLDPNEPILAVIHIGSVHSGLIGSRFADVWASGVPILQYISKSDFENNMHNPDSVLKNMENGLIFYDSDELVATLENMLSDQVIYRTLTASARKSVSHVDDWANLAKEIVV
jgi:hypothetical protein